MTKLNQINALVSGRKGEVEKAVGDLYKIIQKPDLFVGRHRKYRPKDEVNGEKLPDEVQKVQHRVADVVDTAIAKWSELWDLTVQQDVGNQQAKANIVVDGKVILADVPVTSLLFLTKQVNDLETFIGKLPVPDASENWTHDPSQGLLRSATAQSQRTKKVPARFEKAPATDKHPAQVEFFHEDVPVGTWETTQFSSAMPADVKTRTLARVKKLKDAIKLAREEANSIVVKSPVKVGEHLFRYVFAEKEEAQ